MSKNTHNKKNIKNGEEKLKMGTVGTWSAEPWSVVVLSRTEENDNLAITDNPAITDNEIRLDELL